ncbi:MAG TPA: hypothetical protein VN794_12800 [Methylomirabilota bacterium]|nr:hypothetical protein [Methylomirabilota bacterium]
MKGKLYFSTLWMCAAVNLYAQGVFVGSNISARTRVGSLDGPFAGTNIVGQMLGGASPSSLHPVGPIDYHNNGEFAIARITVPDVPANEYAYVQLLAWDSTFWGTNLAGVPNDQLGRTDIASVLLTTGTFPDVVYSPGFTQPAIVPPIPEPSAWALAVLAFGALRIRRFVTKAIK